MCGIAGAMRLRKSAFCATDDYLTHMADAMAHRGPDGSGIWKDQQSAIGFAHRRLSIIDLSDDASQPMRDSTGSLTIVFNGEVYNYKEIREGATVYIPVYHEGGFLMFGDGHAVQGDGEAVGSGVETSLDVEIVVDLKKKADLTTLRVENDEYLISIGNKSGDPLNQALKIATTDMVRWLEEEYELEPWAAHQLIGFQGEYDVAAIAGTIGCKIPRAALARKP